tara:strand:+ start:447 stop:914 length:468 start_codon:yes stop_codon:yes gene_type:complete
MEVRFNSNTINFYNEIPIRAMEIFCSGKFSIDVNYNSIVRYNSKRIIIVFMDQTAPQEVVLEYMGDIKIITTNFYSDNLEITSFTSAADSPQEVWNELNTIKYEDITREWEDFSIKNIRPTENISSKINYLYNGKVNTTQMMKEKIKKTIIKRPK